MAGGEWGARAGGHRPSRSWQALLTPLWAQRRADATSAQGFDATALRTRALSPGRRCRILCWRLSLSSSVIVSPSRCRRRARKRSTIPPHSKCSLHDPNPLPRPVRPLASPITLDIDRLAVRAAATIGRAVPEQWSVLERLYVDRLLDHLEEQHEPAEVDAAVDRFVQELRVCLARGSGAG
jgi:hypothetical protein